MDQRSIPVKILKNRVDILKQHLTYMTNLPFHQSIFPEALKTVRVTPIFENNILDFLLIIVPSMLKNVRILAFTRF